MIFPLKLIIPVLSASAFMLFHILTQLLINPVPYAANNDWLTRLLAFPGIDDNNLSLKKNALFGIVPRVIAIAGMTYLVGHWIFLPSCSLVFFCLT